MDTIAINPQVETSQISLYEPSKVFGMLPITNLGRVCTDNIYRVLLKFPISLIPEDIVILKAILKIYVQNPGLSTISTFTPFALVEDWSPQTVTWENQPSFDATRSGESKYLKGAGFYTFNISELVANWHNHVIPNYGLTIKNNELQHKTFKQITTSINSMLSPRVEISYASKYDGSMIYTRFISKIEEMDTDELYRFSSIINTSLTKTITYHIENLGDSPVEILLQVSPNGIDFFNDCNTLKVISSHEMIYAIPYTFSKYLRIAVKNVNPNKTSRIKIWYQAQE